MPQHLAWPHLHPPGRTVVSNGPVPRAGHQALPRSSQDEHWQVLKDKLAVAAVLLLVLATLSVFVLYLVQQAPHFGSGELTAFATPVPSQVQQSAAGASGPSEVSSIAGTGLGRIPLILISSAVEMAIFVALGLYLRHDMQRKP